jgi:hypothetical protein
MYSNGASSVSSTRLSCGHFNPHRDSKFFNTLSHNGNYPEEVEAVHAIHWSGCVVQAGRSKLSISSYQII